MGVDVEAAIAKLGIKVRRKGDRIWGEDCPLPTHGAPNPAHRWQNFFVRPEGDRAGQYFCYSCKGGGRLLELVVLVLSLSYEDARAWLADLGEAASVPYVRVRFVPVGPRGEPFRIPAGVENRPLAQWPGMAQSYARSRGITDDQVGRWRIGLAYDGRLAHRIVLPTWDGQGRLANYAARTFVDDETRYLAAHASERPDKSALWGEHLWPEPAGRRVGIVFEGAMNGLAIERAFSHMDEEIVVPALCGLSGSRFDHRKAAKLATFRRLILATDPDKAGDEAAEEIAGALRRRVEMVRLEYPTRGADAVDTSPIQIAIAVLRASMGFAA